MIINTIEQECLWLTLLCYTYYNMAKKAKGFGADTYIASKKRKRPGRHSKKDKNTYRGQGRAK